LSHCVPGGCAPGSAVGAGVCGQAAVARAIMMHAAPKRSKITDMNSILLRKSLLRSRCGVTGLGKNFHRMRLPLSISQAARPLALGTFYQRALA